MRTAQLTSFLVLTLVFLSSCGKAPMFDSYVSIKNGWHSDSIISFNVPVNDIEAAYYVSMSVRHNADYPYQNLYLFRTISSASGIEYQDTVDLTLADDRGKWLGEGIGELKTMAYGYGRGGLRFTTMGKYTFTLQQGMRDTLLAGITNVGLTIERIEEQE